MQCPKCGAENPDGALNCNLCFHGFVDRPAPAGPDLTTTSRPRARFVMPAGSFRLVVNGGLAGLTGGWLFLASLTIIHVTGVRVYDFLFSSLGVNQPNLQFFILLLGLFSLLSGGVAGNLEDKREIVPAIRTMAALAGLGLWAGLVFSLKPADATLLIWLTDGPLGILTALSALPLAAFFLGLTESFGEEMELSRALGGAAGGFVSGLATALIVGAAYLTAPVFGAAIPAGAVAVIGFSLKLIIISGIIGFTAGASLWLAIESAENFSS